MSKYKTHVDGMNGFDRRPLPDGYGARQKARKNAKIDELMKTISFRRAMAMKSRGEDPMSDDDGAHTHVCGYDADNPRAIGCGRIFRHTEAEVQGRSRAHFDKLHTCPHCRAKGGLWTSKLSPDDPDILA